MAICVPASFGTPVGTNACRQVFPVAFLSVGYSDSSTSIVGRKRRAVEHNLIIEKHFPLLLALVRAFRCSRGELEVSTMYLLSARSIKPLVRW